MAQSLEIAAANDLIDIFSLSSNRDNIFKSVSKILLKTFG